MDNLLKNSMVVVGFTVFFCFSGWFYIVISEHLNPVVAIMCLIGYVFSLGVVVGMVYKEIKK